MKTLQNVVFNSAYAYPIAWYIALSLNSATNLFVGCYYRGENFQPALFLLSYICILLQKKSSTARMFCRCGGGFNYLYWDSYCQRGWEKILRGEFTLNQFLQSNSFSSCKVYSHSFWQYILFVSYKWYVGLATLIFQTNSMPDLLTLNSDIS